MKFVAISDTHGQHNNLRLPQADVIIHAGDITKRGNKEEIVEFINWFSELPFEYRIFIAGNHDFYFEESSEAEIKKLIPSNVIYLCNCSVVINGIKIWGSPITPYFFNWAFNRHRGNDISQYWGLIPTDTDILITHGPAFSILDKTTRGLNVGCEDLLSSIQQIKPKYHICGHIHEAYGQIEKGVTHYLNASVLDEHYSHKNVPILFEL